MVTIGNYWEFCLLARFDQGWLDLTKSCFMQ